MPGSPEARVPGDPAEVAEVASSMAASHPVDPILCVHCGRTALNGIRCQGICVADGGY